MILDLKNYNNNKSSWILCVFINVHQLIFFILINFFYKKFKYKIQNNNKSDIRQSILDMKTTPSMNSVELKLRYQLISDFYKIYFLLDFFLWLSKSVFFFVVIQIWFFFKDKKDENATHGLKMKVCSCNLSQCHAIP